jgi:ubiquinone/menaquinone biosynthesis C-methylase UbiE
MGWLFAALYDPYMRSTEAACLQAWRAALLATARGRVLEVGAGTGANLAHYPAGLERLVLAEPDAAMRARLAARIAERRQSVEVEDATLEALPFADASFDTAVSTLVLCSVARLERAIAELRRVLAPGGRLLFIEHVVASAPGRRAWQRRLDPLWRRLAGGCRLVRDTEAALVAGGFRLDAVTRESIRKALPFLRPSIRGVALR